MTSVSNIVSRIWRYRIPFVIALFVLGAGIFDEHSVLNILLLTNREIACQDFQPGAQSVFEFLNVARIFYIVF